MCVRRIFKRPVWLVHFERRAGGKYWGQIGLCKPAIYRDRNMGFILSRALSKGSI